jgi:hypothetical protein
MPRIPAVNQRDEPQGPVDAENLGKLARVSNLLRTVGNGPAAPEGTALAQAVR